MFKKFINKIFIQYPDTSLRFSFGKNWASFSNLISDQRVRSAEDSLLRMLSMTNLNGLTFLDIGCGSGLFSLAARNLGATVHSFDYDVDSVETTLRLKEKYYPNDPNWNVMQGSVLDKSFLSNFSNVDIVYSWGVLHHTGDMLKSFDNIICSLSQAKYLFVSIYNDQGFLSKYWLFIKYFYNMSLVFKLIIIISHAPYFFTRYFARRIFIKSNILDRGMDPWRDILDWLGGYPFEVASPEMIVNIFSTHGYCLKKIKTVSSKHGCNEFIFTKF